MQKALLAEYDFCLENGRLLEAERILDLSMTLHRYWLTNPGELMSYTAQKTLRPWAAYLAGKNHFEGLDLLDDLPTRALLHRATVQSIWHHQLILQNLMAKDVLVERGFSSNKLIPPFFMAGECRKIFDESFFFYQAQINAPPDLFKSYEMEDSQSPINFAGREIVRQYLVEHERFLAESYGITLVYLDLLRIHLFLNEAGLPWEKKHVESAATSLVLVNPFDWEPYSFDSEGRLLLFDEGDGRWQELNIVDLPIPGLFIP